MTRYLIGAGLLPFLAVAAPAPAAACGGNGRAGVLVAVSGLKSGEGTLRVQAYGPEPADFLRKGRYARRVDTPLAGRRALEVCLVLPRPGRYAVAVRHDANASGKSDWNDGGGFSRNPKLSLVRLRPRFEEVAVDLAPGTSRVRVVMNYRRGLRVGPLG